MQFAVEFAISVWWRLDGWLNDGAGIGPSQEALRELDCAAVREGSLLTGGEFVNGCSPAALIAARGWRWRAETGVSGRPLVERWRGGELAGSGNLSEAGRLGVGQKG